MFRSSRTVFVMDLHSEGEPVRVILGGLPPILGQSMADKVAYFKQHLDPVRSALLLPPRGSREHLGSVLTAPCSDGGDFGVIFLDATGYLAMCGDAVIATASAAVAAGLILGNPGQRAPNQVTEEPDQPAGPVHMTFDTPAGAIHASVSVTQGEARQVSFANVPAFVFREGVQVRPDGLGPLQVDIAFGGNFCAIVPADNVGVRVALENTRTLKEVGQAIKEAVNRTCAVSHPEMPTINRVDLVMLYERLDEGHYLNAVIFGDRQLVLSPCGTGSSALLALVTSRGELPFGRQLRSESVLGTSYYLRALERTSVGGLPGLVPSVEGRAYVTGLYQLVLDPEDPLQAGFLVG